MSKNFANDFDLDDPDLPTHFKDAALQSGGYPYDDRLDRKIYQHQLRDLQIELVKLQA